MQNKYNVEVGDTSRKGKGLFAIRAFKKGEQVLDWNIENRFLTESEIEDLPEVEKKYIALYKGKYLLIPEPERYMNHSCDPNTETQADGTDIASRDIEVGEEITGDYTKEGSFLGFTCLCASSHCKQRVADTRL